ncbi:MAG: LamG-like jellyroll fold domain-containing protein [archaeon]
MKKFSVLFTLLILFNTIHVFGQTTRRVQSQYATIQEAIIAAQNGDTIVVSSGTYYENINFSGKSILLKSDGGALNTTINGSQAGSCVSFISGETSAAVINGFTITNGSGTVVSGIQRFGGGIYCYNGSNPTIKNCIIIGNSAFAGSGGGISCWYASAKIKNCIIKNNSNHGISNAFGNGVLVVNCLIYGNYGTDYGGGISAGGGSSPTIINSTIVQNDSYHHTNTGIYAISGGTVINSIVRDNVGVDVTIIQGTTSVTYSNIEGGFTGEGNIDVDPLFIDPSNSNYHLSDTSPCIGAASSSNAPSEDIEHNPRPNPSGSNPDMGAYENALGNINSQSALFDGNQDRIRVTDARPVNPNAIPSAYQISGTAITVEAWIFPMDVPTGTDSRYIIARPANTGFGVDPYQTFALFIYGNAPFSHQPRIGISITDGTHPSGTGYEVFVEDTAAVKIGQWTHVAGTYDGTNVKLYINGVIVHQLPLNVTMGSGSTGLYVGGASGGYFKGMIDEVRLWNTTRTQSDIQAAMNSILAGTESGLMGCWPMDSVYTTSGGLLATVDNTSNHNDLAVQYSAKLVPFPQGSTVQIAPTNLSILPAAVGGGYALTGTEYRAKLLADGWPLPAINVISQPSGATINGDSLIWTPSPEQFGWFPVIATLTNTAGALTGTVNIFVEGIRSASNQLRVDVTHRGKLGAWGLYGKGILYKSKNGLYAGDFSLVDRDNEKFAGGLYTSSNSFNPIEGFTTVPSRFPGFTAFKTSFADEWETNRIGVRVFQTVHSSTTAGDDKYAIIEYRVVNESGVPIGDLFSQFTADFDIGALADNLGGYDSLLQMTYSYEPGGANNSYFYGFSLLNQTVSGEAVFISGTDSLYVRSTSLLTTKTPNPTMLGDYRNQISTGPFNLAQGETLTVAFAMFAGDSLNDICTSAMRAKQVYNNGLPVEEVYNSVPDKFTLHQNYPNPFNPTTNIEYAIPKRSAVRIEVIDLNGRLIETLVNRTQEPGKYQITWNASRFPSGVYFYKITAGDFVETRKCLLIK